MKFMRVHNKVVEALQSVCAPSRCWKPDGCFLQIRLMYVSFLEFLVELSLPTAAGTLDARQRLFLSSLGMS